MASEDAGRLMLAALREERLVKGPGRKRGKLKFEVHKRSEDKYPGDLNKQSQVYVWFLAHKLMFVCLLKFFYSSARSCRVLILDTNY